MNQECTHSAAVNYDNILAELTEAFGSSSAALTLFASVKIQEAKENWICIDNDCPKRMDEITNSNELIEHKKKYSGKVYINIFSLEIVCFICNCEIHDEVFTRQPLRKIVNFKMGLRRLVSNLYSEITKIPIGNTMKDYGVLRLEVPGLSNSYPTLFYLLWSVPFFRFILKRIYLIELASIHNHKETILSPGLFRISRAIFFLDTEAPNSDPNIIQDAIFAFAEKNPTFILHSSFDVFEAFSDFLSFAHLQLITPDPQPRERQRKDSRTELVTIPSARDDRASLEDTNLASQSSPLFAGISGEIVAMYTCLTCGHAEEKPENFMSLNFKRLQKDHVLQIRKRFASEGYKEGIVTKEVDQGKRKGFLGIFKPKPVFQPVLTIRDYFCFLNLIQSYNIRSFCTECNQETDTRLSKLLHRAPEILIVGFSEADDPQPATADSNFEFRIDLEFDISPFVNQVQNKYELLSVVTKESDALGIDNDVIYIKGAQGEWLRVDLHSIIPIDPNFLQELVSPSILVYQKKLSPDTERKNLESNFTLRDQIAGVELSPLPCFYMEELMVLGIKPEISLAAYICQHRRLMPTYRELYPQKSSPDLLYEWEANFIQNKRGIKPERKLCGEASPTVRRLLIGTTLLQKPVVEYVLEKTNTREVVQQFEQAWKEGTCHTCLTRLNNLKKRRSLEQYLFLKYDMSYAKRNQMIPFEWGSSWYFYLFYDTELFQQSAISTNFPLPVPPGPLNQAPNSMVVTLNFQLMEIIRHLYLEVPWSQKALDTINKRDIHMADKAIEGTLSEDEYEIILLRVRKLVSVRIQKIELENFVDYWVGEGINPETLSDMMNKSPEGGLDPKRMPNKGSSGTLGSGGTNSNEYAQEYFDSDSEKDEKVNPDSDHLPPGVMIKKTLSQIDEERTEMMKDDHTLADHTPASPSKNLQFGQSASFSKAMKSVGMASPGQRVATGGCDRTQTEYITTESAMKSYIQKNLMIRDFRTRKPQSATNVEALSNNPLSPLSLGTLAQETRFLDRSGSERLGIPEHLDTKYSSSPSPFGKTVFTLENHKNSPAKVESTEKSEPGESGFVMEEVGSGSLEGSKTIPPTEFLKTPDVNNAASSRARLNSNKFVPREEPIPEERNENAIDSEETRQDEKGTEVQPVQDHVVQRNSSSEEFEDQEYSKTATPAGAGSLQVKRESS